MWRHWLCAGQAGGGGGEAPGSEEANLDSHLVAAETPLHEFLRDKARRAPWWTISFLVHLIALLVAWRWPYTALAERPLADRDIGVAIWHPEDIKPEVEPRPPTPPPDIPIPDFEIGPETRLPSAPESVTPLKPPSPPPPGAPDAPPIEVKMGDLSPKMLTLPDPTARPTGKGKNILGERDKLSKGDPNGKGPGGGPNTPGDDVKVILNPIIAGLLWLVQAQEPDGSWNAKRFEGSSTYQVGMTGFALLAFEGAGFTHKPGSRFSKTIGNGLSWLYSKQREDGSFPWETFYEQGIATMAVCEAYAMTKDPVVRRMAQRAIDYICRVQPEHGGFRYGGAVPQEEGDMSVTGWQIMAIKSAMMANLNVPPQAVERSRTFLRNSWRDYGASAYLVGSKEAGSSAISAIGMASRIFLSERKEYDGEIMATARLLHDLEAKDLKAVPGGATGQLASDLYYTYYSSLAMFQVGGEFWLEWRKMYRDTLLNAQVRERHDKAGRYVKGSWDCAADRWGSRGGRIYTTALALLSLEVPFRFLPVYQMER